MYLAGKWQKYGLFTKMAHLCHLDGSFIVIIGHPDCSNFPKRVEVFFIFSNLICILNSNSRVFRPITKRNNSHTIQATRLLCVHIIVIKSPGNRNEVLVCELHSSLCCWPMPWHLLFSMNKRIFFSFNHFEVLFNFCGFSRIFWFWLFRFGVKQKWFLFEMERLSCILCLSHHFRQQTK